MPMTAQSYSLKTYKISLVLVLLFAAGTVSCYLPKEEKPDPEFVRKQAERLGYDLENPKEKIKLHYDLQEISGLSIVENGVLACVQDELGRVYFYDLNEKEIIKNIKFAKSGDYEGIEIVNGNIYVVESNGTLSHFNTTGGNEKEVKANSIRTPLTLKNDVEGLGLLPKSNKLLIACKGQAGIGGEKVKGKAVYAYDLDENQFEMQPFLRIRKSDVTKFMKKNPDNYTMEKAPDFKPSGIAVHPKTNKIYLLNSVGKLLIILDGQGNIEDVAVLNPKTFRQPEGICFAPNGDLFIASEGGGGRGYILTFSYLK